MSHQRIRLTEAAKIVGVSVKALRTERDRGRLVIWRLAGKDWTSLSEIDRMFELCHAPAKEPGFGSDQNAKTSAKNNPPSGSLETETILKARNAALATVRALREGLPNISQQNTRQNAETVVTLHPSL